MLGHFGKGLPTESFVVDARAAPIRFILKNLVQKRCNPRASFTVSGTPSTTAAEGGFPAQWKDAG